MAKKLKDWKYKPGANSETIPKLKRMSCSELALRWTVAKDQGDKKAMNKISKVYLKKGCIKK
jgi:hypothetical protein